MQIPGASSSGNNVMSGEELKTLLYMMLRGDVELPIQKSEQPAVKKISTENSSSPLLDKEA